MNPPSLFRRLLPIAGSLVLSSSLALAIQDANTNGLSDVWERHYNGGNLFSGANPAHLSAADPDTDGWDNAKEAIAGTDPFSAALPQGWVRTEIATHPEVEGLFVVSWPSLEGKVYRLKVSPDLAAWADFGELILGTGQEIAMAVDAMYEDGTIPERLFWRVKIEDDDPDGDTLTSWEELALGYNPHHSDSDLDGIPDNTDTTPLANNAVASPDGAGLVGTTLSTNMIGRWDFEAVETVANPPNFLPPFRFADSMPAARHAASFGVLTNQGGMVSNSTDHAGGYVTIPGSLLDNRTQYSVSFWAALDPDSVSQSDGRPIGLFTHHRVTPHTPAGSPNWGLFTVTLNGLWVQKEGANEILRAGTYAFANHNNGTPLNPPTTTVTGLTFVRPLGTIDDGKWHHYVLIKNNAVTSLYIDGVQQTQSGATHSSPTLSTNIYNGVSVGRMYGPPPEATAYRPPNQAVAEGRFDRLRVWSDRLSAAEIAALYHEDIDRDGLWDITENKTALWRDLNGDEIETADEVSYLVSPFLADPADRDHDRDGLTSLAEQALGTGIFDADSDDDGLPDGYDEAHGLGALVPDGSLSSDADGDGLTLAQELAYGTNPAVADSDGDGTSDGAEVAQNGLPNDASDGGDAPDPSEVLTLRLGVGDESGSKSEDYHLVAYRYDPVTRSESEVYRHHSGGYGQYTEKNIPQFRKNEEYVFRIQWQGSKLTSDPGTGSDGPDYDYTMKVEPVSSDPALVITDAFDPAAGVPEEGYQLLGEHNDVQDFLTIADTKVVHATGVRIDLAVDTNMNGTIESLPDGVAAGLGWPGSKIDDRELDDADPPRPVVIDVNNNNTDTKDSSSPTKAQVDNANAVLDTAADKMEMIAGRSGHSFGELRVFAYPVKKFKNGEMSLKLSFAEAAHANIVRVFDWRLYDANNGHPTELLGPGKTSVTLDSSEFFGEGFNLAGGPQLSYRDLVMEGITYGTAVLRLELVKNGGTPQVIASDEVRVSVNVDRVEQKPDDVAANKDARVLRGQFPHHVGIRKTGLTSGDGIRAIRGTVSVRIPGAGGKTRLTPMEKHPLRPTTSIGDDANSGASIWVGLAERDGQGKLSQWVQTGLRWVQPTGRNHGSVPAIYLETGDTYNNIGAKSLVQLAGYGTTSSWLGGGVVEGSAIPLATWDSAPVKYSFVLLKKPVGTNSEGQDTSLESWQLILKDERPGVTPTNNSFVHLTRGKPVPPGTVGSEISDALEQRYKGQKFRDLDALFETNQSITFAPGSPDQHAVISGLHFAIGYAGTPPAAPNPADTNGKIEFYNWAMGAFSWEAAPVSGNDLNVEVKTGRSLTDGGAENGSASHPEWNAAVPAGGGVEIWDSRSYGF